MHTPLKLAHLCYALFVGHSLLVGVSGRAAHPLPPTANLVTRHGDKNFPTNIRNSGIYLNDPQQGGKLLNEQGSGGFQDALTFIETAISNSGPDVSMTIYKKYFNEFDHHRVMRVLERISDAHYGTCGKTAQLFCHKGSMEMSNIQASASRLRQALAQLEARDADRPNLIFGERAWEYQITGELDDGICERLDAAGLQDRTHRFLATIILHAYFHWNKLFHGIMHEMMDLAVSYKATRALNKEKAVYNAESYACFLKELYLTLRCGKEEGWDLGD
ncbi:Uu.00g104230.m01.CDS01 [Anthostomella pinea]|uniref:Uu.00g104230.m01.CDS01 n=1 Tax=Anthostomella pinea TaxID=933095 RepID=A0AAI8YFP4_9PEZI|nr:Uu.00g104230.m01.CDS01 [Anthostomella pinea]